MAWYNKYSKEVESVQNNRRERRNLRNRLKQIQMVKTWQLVLIFLLMSFVSASLLRLNNVGMIERRDAVMTADQSCDKFTTLRIWAYEHRFRLAGSSFGKFIQL